MHGVTDSAVTARPRRGVTAPLGIASAFGALWLSILVLRRTARRTPSRIAAWVLLGFSLLPWALIAAFWISLSFVDQLPSSSGS